MGSMGIDATISESSTPSDSTTPRPSISHQSSQKRSAGDAGLKNNGTRPAKSVKRRASKACQCCRARKVRCNVVEHGAPCTNCRLDEVECIVSESKRKKFVRASSLEPPIQMLTERLRKWSNGPEMTPQVSHSQTFKRPSSYSMSAQPPYEPIRRTSEHVPHSLCKQFQLQRRDKF